MIFWTLLCLLTLGLHASNLCIGNVTSFPQKAKVKPNEVISGKSSILLKESSLHVDGEKPSSVEVYRNGRPFSRYLTLPECLEVAAGDVITIIWKNSQRLVFHIEKRNELKMFLTSPVVQSRAVFALRMLLFCLLLYAILAFYDGIHAVETKTIPHPEIPIRISVLDGSDGSRWMEVRDPTVLGPGLTARLKISSNFIGFDRLYPIADRLLKEIEQDGHSTSYPNAIIAPPFNDVDY